MTNSTLDVLFTPFRLKNLTLRNRFVMPAMQRGFVEDGVPTIEMADYLADRGRGGVALIFSEAVAPDHPSGYARSSLCHLTKDAVGAWRRVIDSVKNTGALFVMQLWHPGAVRKIQPDSRYADYPTLSPSGLIQMDRPAAGRAMTLQDLQEVKESYMRAAELAKEIGVDGIELHCCHGFFLDQFLWQETNIRDDEYGGSTLAERGRYPAEIVAAVRSVVGEDYMLSCRFSQFKEVDYGARIADTPDQLQPFLAMMRNAGADCFNASSRRFYRPEWPDSEHPARGVAGWVKSLGDLPTISCGSVGLDSDMFEDLFDHKDPTHVRVERDLKDVAGRIGSGEFDLIGVGRAQIANPDFVSKVRDGRFDEIEIFKKSIHLPKRRPPGEAPGAASQFRKVVADT